MEWFSKWFNEDYELIYPHRNNSEARQMIELFESRVGSLESSEVLDMCCGLGRVSFELVKKAKRVHGFDLSPYFIDKCLEANGYSTLSFEKRDMRDMNFSNEFDVVFHIFTSFGYFDSIEENTSLFNKVNAALRPNGYYFFDFLNEKYVRNHLVAETRTESNGRHILQTRTISNNRVVKKIKIDSGNSINEYEESVMLIRRETLEQAFEEYGFSVEYLFGDYESTEFDNENSPRLIYILRKNG